MAEVVCKTPERIAATNAETLMTELADAASRAIAEDEKKLVVDMTDTVYISSAGLRALMTAMKRMRAANGTFVLRGVDDRARDTLTLTGVLNLVQIE